MINNINSTGGGPCTAPMQSGGSGNGNGNPPALRKIMVVAEPNRESVVALQYALSHVLFEQDELILLHVENQNPSWKYTFSTFLKRPSVGSSSSSSSSSSSNMGSSEGGGSCGAVPVDVDFLEEMKSACKVAHPKVRVRVERVEMEGKDKANAILFQSHQLGIDVIVIGQRRSLSTAILGNKRALRGTKVVDTAEYLIENSKCTCVAVQKKGQNAGFLLNTKTHRNFWLLA